MKEFQKPRHFRQFIASRPAQLLLLLLLIMMVGGVWRLYWRERSLALEEEDFQNQLLSLDARQRELRQTAVRLETERGVEEEIRERFGVVKEGEKVINLVGEMAVVNQSTTTSSWWNELKRGISLVVGRLLPKQ